MPDARTVLAFHLHDAEPDARDWWVVVDDRETDLCDHDPGYEITARIEASLEALTRVWIGELAWEDAVRAGWIRTFAPEGIRRRLPRWLKLSTFAGVPRPNPSAARAGS